jgi:hypothetical protein
LSVDLQTNGRDCGLYLDYEARNPGVDLIELGLCLVDSSLKRGRRARGQCRADDQSISFPRFDELAQCSLAFGDAQLVGGSGKDLLGTLKLVERLGKVPGSLQLVALLEQIACCGTLSVADLRARTRSPRHGREDDRDADRDQVDRGAHGANAEINQYPGSAPVGEGLGARGFEGAGTLAVGALRAIAGP